MMKQIKASRRDTPVLDTRVTGVILPMNTKYVSTNPISRWLVKGFMGSLVDLAAHVHPHIVLDIGCGEGLVLRQFKAVWNDAEFYGMDMETNLLNAACAIAPESIYVCGDIFHLPLPDRSYDVVICTEVLEHLERPDVALRELARVSRGHCLLSVPHEPWWRLSNIMRGSYWRAWGNTPGHTNHWTAVGFLDLVRVYFDVVETRMPYPWIQVLARTRE